jgi:hypothetical protein
LVESRWLLHSQDYGLTDVCINLSTIWEGFFNRIFSFFQELQDFRRLPIETLALQKRAALPRHAFAVA